MNLNLFRVTLIVGSFLASSAWASMTSQPAVESKTSYWSSSSFEASPVLLAKKSNKRRKAAATKSRELNIERQANYKKDQKEINFDSAALYGQRKAPLGSMIGQGKSDKNFDLIRMRERWHPEMYRSTSTLELGR